MEIQEELQRYLSSRENNGALLLNGGWGSGKTFLAKSFQNQLREKDEYAAAIISLFGVSNTAELHQKVKEGVMNLIMDAQEHTKRTKFFQRMKELGESMLNVSQFNPKMGWMARSVMTLNINDLINVQKKIYCFRKGKVKELNLVLIFDDVERCKISMDMLLGAINEYTEVRGIKTILIADESHISDTSYWVTKEKIIGQTLNLCPDYHNVVSSMLNSFVETAAGYRQFLVEQTDLIRMLFQESGNENLRSLKKILVSFERVYEVWSSEKIPLEFLPQVFYVYGAIHFEANRGNFERKSDGSFRFSAIEIKRVYALYEKQYLLYSLACWVVDGVWNEQMVRQEISIKFRLEKEKPERELLYCNLSELTDQMMEQGIPAALESAYSGHMDSSEMVRLLERFVILRIYCMENTARLDVEKLLLGLKKREELLENGKTSEIMIPYFISKRVEEKMTPQEIEFYRQIQRLPRRSEAWEIRRKVIAFALGEKREHLHVKYQHLICFDDEMLEILQTAYQNGDKTQREKLITNFKDFQFFDDDISTQEEQEKTKQNLRKFYHWMEAFPARTTSEQIFRMTMLDLLGIMKKSEKEEETSDEKSAD